MRDGKQLILILVVIIATIGSVSAYYVMEDVEYTNLTLTGMQCQVPADNITPNTQNPDYQTYNDPKYNLSIVVYREDVTQDNTTENQTNENSQYEQKFMEAKNSLGEQTPVNREDISFNKTESGLYSYYTSSDGVNVLVETSDSNVLLHIIQTLKINPTITLQENGAGVMDYFVGLHLSVKDKMPTFNHVKEPKQPNTDDNTTNNTNNSNNSNKNVSNVTNPNDTITTSLSVSADDTTISGSLTDENGSAVANAQISISINGQSMSATTDSSGHYQVSYTRDPEEDTEIVVSFAGNDKYKASSASTSIEADETEENDTDIDDMEDMEDMDDTNYDDYDDYSSSSSYEPSSSSSSASSYEPESYSYEDEYY